MIVTHATIKGPEHFVFLTRGENPSRLTVERSVYASGAYRIRCGVLQATDSLAAAYTLLGPLLYGTAHGAPLDEAQRVELESLFRLLLAEM